MVLRYTISDEAYGSSWDGNQDGATKNALYDYLASVTGTFVPYTGATGDVDLGSNDISAANITTIETTLTTKANQIGTGTAFTTNTTYAETVPYGSADRPGAHTGTKQTDVAGVTGMTQPDGAACPIPMNYAAAEAWAISHGARLPTQQEVEGAGVDAGAVHGTGCSFDGTAVWTQTEGVTAGTHMVADGDGGTALTAERNDSLTANVRIVYDDVALTASTTTYEDLDDVKNGVKSVAAGSTLGLQQELLANDAQPAKTVLAVGNTTSGKVQGVSLGDGNVIEVYASGADFNSGTVLYREFMAFGEPIVFTGLTNGAIITSTQGFYGVSEQVGPGTSLPEGPMPLLSFGLAFKSTFLYAFRESAIGYGFIHVVNGPLSNTIKLTDGSGVVQLSQENIQLDPWEYRLLHLNGNKEYILEGTDKMMACVHSSSASWSFSDSRLIMPLTNDGITWPRSGFVSAPYDDTVVDWWTRDNAEGSLNSGNGVSPGSPVDFDAAPPTGTGASDDDYNSNGATRVKAVGLISAYSGADSAGAEATPLMPTNGMSQIVAQPFYVDDSGDGGGSGVAIASPYVGTAKIYEWNSGTNQLDLAYTVPLNRNGVTVTTKEDQNHPAAGQVSNDGTVTLVGDLDAGLVIADVPITVVTQSATQNSNTVRSQGGATTTAIDTKDDEVLMLGHTPTDIAAEIREDEDGVLRRRTIDNTGTETWEVA